MGYAKRYLSPSNNECTNAFLLVVTFVFAPLYVISRMFNITLVVMVPLFLWGTEGMDIFWKMDLFQILLWIGYLVAMLIWMMTAMFVFREEFYLWHIAPDETKYPVILEEF